MRCGGVVLAASITLVGCGGGLDGVYRPEGGAGFFEQIEFRSGGKVEITFMGTTKEGDFEVDGDRVRITVSGDTQILRLDGDGCVDGGGIIGRYCPGGSAPGAQAGTRPASDGKPSGTYQARDGNDVIQLAFGSGSEVRMTITEGAETYPPISAHYSMRGDRVTIRIPELDESFELTFRDGVLEGAVQGDSVRFTRR